MRLVRYIPEDQMPDEVNELTNPLPAPEAEDRLSPAELEQANPSRQIEQAEQNEQHDGPVVDTPEEAAQAADEADATTGLQVDLGILEALLFSTHHPLTAPRLAELMGLPSSKPLRKAIKALNAHYEESRRSFRVEQVAGGYQLLTLPEYGEYLKQLHQREADAKLTKAALETLAIIAYKQPILRAEIEAIRGVASGETVRSLMEKHLVKIAGRAEEPGRPILYGTTKRFLELFGLNTLKDLPKPEELLPSQKQSPKSSSNTKAEAKSPSGDSSGNGRQTASDTSRENADAPAEVASPDSVLPQKAPASEPTAAGESLAGEASQHPETSQHPEASQHPETPPS